MKLASPALEQFTAGFPAQQDFVADRARFSLAGAAVRTGKTYSAARKFLNRVLRDIARDPHSLKTYWIIAPTSEECVAQKIELVDLIGDALVAVAKQGDDNRWRNIKTGTGKVWLRGNALLEFKSAARPEGLVARKVSGIWWTEIARSKYAAWANVRSRLANTNGWLIADTSPYGRCWFFNEVWEPATRGEFPDACCHIWRAVDSPYIPQSEIEHARATLPPSFFRREFEASWEAFTGQVYASFDPASHVCENPLADLKMVVVGADINTSETAPAAFVVMEIDSHDNAHVAWEYYEKIGLDFTRYAQAIADAVRMNQQRCRDVRLVIDPSMHNQFKAELRRLGVDPRNARNALLPGIRNMAQQIHAGRLTFSPSCRNTVNEIQSYKWRVSSAGVVTEQPDKSSPDHLMDACRYACMEAFSGFEQTRQTR